MTTPVFAFNPLASRHQENSYPLYAPAQREAPIFSTWVLPTPVDPAPAVHLVPAQPLTYLPSLLNRALQHLQVHWDVFRQTHGHRPSSSSTG